MKSKLFSISLFLGTATLLPGLQVASPDAPSIAASCVASADGRIVLFYPIATPQQTIEGPYWSHSTNCFFAFPENYAEAGVFVDPFVLSTREGVSIVIEHEWTWGNLTGVKVRRATEGRTLPRDGLVSYTLLTTSGPPVIVELSMMNGYVAGHTFRIAEPGGAMVPVPATRPSTDSQSTIEELVGTMEATSSPSELLAAERQLFLRDRRAASNLVALISGRSARLRESAAALARWFPGSIAAPALAERIDDPDPRVVREARYSLNILLLREGRDADTATARELVPRMLDLFVRELLRNPNYTVESRRKFLLAEEIAVLDDRHPSMQPLEIASRTLERSASPSLQPRDPIRFVFPSVDQYDERVRKSWVPAVRLHAIRISGNYARVALSGMAEPNGDSEMIWVALFGRTADGWRVLAFPPYNAKYSGGGFFRSNLNPLAFRDYGGLRPEDLEKFTFCIERIRTVDLRQARLAEKDIFDFRWNRWENGPDPQYEPCLRPYLTDSNQAVRVAACLALGRLGREDVIPQVVNLFADSRNQYVRDQACRVILNVLVPRIEKEGNAGSQVVLGDLLETADAYLARDERDEGPDGQKATAKAIVLNDYALLELRWENHGVTLLGQHRDTKWRVLGAICRFMN